MTAKVRLDPNQGKPPAAQAIHLPIHLPIRLPIRGPV
jgi:hypothetical protein